ncbi:hypothetical protein ACIGGF_12265 [Rhodococcus sp. NPDC078407]|uniref:hypothetical protein n=1 Tax=Rhodococcus sp. NPDC078407 TaxID=3364509 RepID=UPI0037C710D1
MTSGDTDTPPTELTDVMQSAIRTAHAEGLSQLQIAKQLGVPQPNISRWSKRMGLLWDSKRTVAANDAARERIKAARFELAEQFLADVKSIRERFWSEYTMVVNTPTGPQRVYLDLPDAKGVADIAAGIERLVKAHENLTRLGGGSNQDHAKSMLMQLQNDLAKYAIENEAELFGDQRVTTPALTSGDTADSGLSIHRSKVIDHE